MLWRPGRLLSFEMAKNDLVEAPLGVSAAKPLLKRRCQSDVSTPNQMEILFIYLFMVLHSILYAALLHVSQKQVGSE